MTRKQFINAVIDTYKAMGGLDGLKAYWRASESYGAHKTLKSVSLNTARMVGERLAKNELCFRS